MKMTKYLKILLLIILISKSVVAQEIKKVEPGRTEDNSGKQKNIQREGD